MSETVIRNAVINIKLEVDQRMADLSRSSPIVRHLEEIEAKAKQAQNVAHSALNSIGNHPSLTGTLVGSLSGKQSVVGSETSIVGQVMQGLASRAAATVPALGQITNAAGGAGTAFTAMGSAATGLGVSLGPIAVVVTAVTGSVLALSQSLKEAQANGIAFNQMLAQTAEQAGVHTISSVARHSAHAHELINARQDLSHYTTMPGREAQRIQRENAIRAEQAKIAHLPLAEQIEARERMEAQGRAGEQRDEIDASQKHLQDRHAELVAQRDKLLKQSGNIRQSFQNAEKAREENKRHRDWFGYGAERVGAALNPFAMFSGGNSVSDSIASAIGGTTGVQAENYNAQNRKEGTEGRMAMLKSEQDALEQVKQLTKDIAANEQAQMDKASQRLAVTREEAALLRQQAESGAERQRLSERSFGMMSPGQQARLRRVADKAERGEQLTYRERQLLSNSPFDQAKVANEQAEAIAKDPRNAKYFAESRGRQAERQSRADNAHVQAQNEGNNAVKELDKLLSQAEARQGELVGQIKRLHVLIEMYDAMDQEIKLLADEAGLRASKQRSYFAG